MEDNNTSMGNQVETTSNSGYEKKLIISGIALLIVGAIFFISILPENLNIFKKSSNRLPVTNEDFIKARETFTINPSMSKDLLEKALPEVKIDSEEEGYIKLYLGTVLLTDEERRGISLLKEVSLNTNYLPSTRSSAINNLALYFDNRQNEILAELIFSGPVWSGFYDRAVKEKYISLHNATLKAFEWSVEVSPNYLASYKVASMYGLILRVSDSKDRKKNYAKKVEDYIKIGDTNLTTSLKVRNDPENYVSQVVNGLLHKAAAMEQLYIYNNKLVSISDIEEVYELAKKYLNENSGVYQAKILIGKHYYNYAAFLSRQVRPVPTDKIKEALSQITTNLNDPINESLKNAHDDPKASVFKNEIISLANIDSDFKNHLLQIGWISSDFSLK